MLRKTSMGKMNHDDIKQIYKSARADTDEMVKLGKIKQERSESEWAGIVVKEMNKRDYKVSRNVIDKLR